MIRIAPPMAGTKPQTGFGTKIYDAAGNEIEGVTSISILIEPGSFITADVSVCADFEEVWAYPFMSESAFLSAAERYGYEVKKK